MLYSLLSGNSLDATIDTLTQSAYTSMSNFVSNIDDDPNVYDFVRSLVGNTGSGLGSILTGDLTDQDL